MCRKTFSAVQCPPEKTQNRLTKLEDASFDALKNFLAVREHCPPSGDAQFAMHKLVMPSLSEKFDLLSHYSPFATLCSHLAFAS